MGLIADTHVHLYPFYDFDRAFESALINLNRAAASMSEAAAVRAICLTERAGCDVFSDFLSGARRFPQARFAAEKLEEGSAIRVTKHGSDESFIIFPGRQILSLEKIEVLSLLSSSLIADGLNLTETLRRVISEGGIPVLPWAPGKWLGARGRLVAGVLNSGAFAPLGLGDTTLRPELFPEPKLFLEGRRRGCMLFAGTDPLPISGEESVIGSYSTYFTGRIEEQHIAESFRRAILDAGMNARIVGKRSSFLKALSRLIRNEAARRL